MRWRVTSYSESESGGDRIPRSWVLQLTDYRLAVHRLTDVDNVWFASCIPQLFNCKQLESTDIRNAQLEAENLLCDRFNRGLAELQSWHRSPSPSVEGVTCQSST